MADVAAASIGGYTVGREIGRGSFATVYVGSREDGEPRLVAIKTVNREKLNRKLAENLETEIKLMREMRHVNIVSLIGDIVKTERHIHLIMEFCSLGDLSAYIKKKGMVTPFSMDTPAAVSGDTPLAPAPARRSLQAAVNSDPTINNLAGAWGGLNEGVARHFLHQLASAVEFLRSHNLIHRDIKPQNLLLSPAPTTEPPVTLPHAYKNIPSYQPLAVIPPLPRLKLADFGFARALPTHSLASTLCGSPLYMAPEILRGDRYDAKADLWSVGAVVYEMLCGRPPYKASNHVELLRKIDRAVGGVRFPGDDENASGRASVLVTPSPLSQNHPAAALFAVSLGSSPRFSAGSLQTNAMPISDDLKDLAWRLLKRNPIERMSFEEFFLHPAVREVRSAAHTVGLVQKSVEGPHIAQKAESLSDSSPLISSPSVSSLLFAQSSPHQQQQQQQQKADDNRNLLFFDGDLSIKSSNRRPSSGSPRSPQNIMNIEAPFPEYKVDSIKLFAGLNPPQAAKTPTSAMQQLTDSTKTNQHTQLHQQPFVSHLAASAVNNASAAKVSLSQPPLDEAKADNSSSLSSLGSIEFSDDDLQSGSSSPSSDASKSPISSQKDTGTASVSRNRATTSASSRFTAPETGSLPDEADSHDDFVVVEKKVVEVNWISNDRRCGSIKEDTSVANQDGPTFMPMLPIDDSKRLLKSGDGVRSITPPSPRNNGSITGRIAAAVSAVASIVSGGGSNAGNNGGGGSSGLSPDGKLPRVNPVDASSGGGQRVFGSLRDSAHQFLESSASSPHGGVALGQYQPLGGMSHLIPSRRTSFEVEDSVFASALTSLNLISLRAHAVNSVAESRYSVFSANLQRQSAVEAEDILTIYIGALGLYQAGMDLIRIVWERNGFGGVAGSEVDLVSLSKAVQWIRNRFNECLEKAESVRQFAGGGIGGETENIEASQQGRSFERLVYETALDISKNAASQEASNHLQAAEAGYVQAVLLLEAAMQHIHTDGNSSESDMFVIERFLTVLGKRLTKIRERMPYLQNTA